MLKFVLLHLLISIIFYLILFNRLREKNVSFILIFSILILLPAIGPIIMLVIFFSNLYFKGIMFEGIKVDYSLEASTEFSRNLSNNIITPFDEVFYNNNVEEKREIVMDLIKEDAIKWCGKLRVALDDFDSEVSHYAAIALTEVRRQLTNQIMLIENDLSKDSLNITKIYEYFSAAKKNIYSGVWNEEERNNFMQVYASQIEKFSFLAPISEELFEDKIICELESSNFRKAEEFCMKYTIAFNQSERPYLMYMKYYLRVGNLTNFRRLARSFSLSEHEYY